MSDLLRPEPEKDYIDAEWREVPEPPPVIKPPEIPTSNPMYRQFACPNCGTGTIAFWNACFACGWSDPGGPVIRL